MIAPAEIPFWFDGRGMIAFDYCVAFIELGAAIVQWWRVIDNGASRSYRTVRVMIALGWSLWFVRLSSALWQGYDPIIAPPAILSIMLIGGGSIILNVMRK